MLTWDENLALRVSLHELLGWLNKYWEYWNIHKWTQNDWTVLGHHRRLFCENCHNHSAK
jgi:hypothetical protein